MILSDNESWVDSDGNAARSWGYRRGTGTVTEFRKFQQHSPNCKLVNVDIQPYGTTQVPDAPSEVMNIGGFSDNVFETIGKFLRGETGADAHVWVREIEAINLDAPKVEG